MNYEGAHNHHCSLMRTTSRQTQWLTVAVIHLFTGNWTATFVSKCDSWCGEKVLRLMLQNVGEQWKQEHLTCCTLNTGVKCSKRWTYPSRKCTMFSEWNLYQVSDFLYSLCSRRSTQDLESTNNQCSNSTYYSDLQFSWGIDKVWHIPVHTYIDLR